MAVVISRTPSPTVAFVRHKTGFMKHFTPDLTALFDSYKPKNPRRFHEQRYDFLGAFDLLKLQQIFRRRSNVSKNSAAEISRDSAVFANIVYFLSGEIYNVYHGLMVQMAQ